MDKSQVRSAELAIAHYIAYSGISINAADGFADLIKLVIPDSKIIKDIKLHRTKITQIITKQLAPYLRNRVLKLMNENFFTLLIDSSTDCSIRNITLIMAKMFIDGKNEYYLYKSLELSDTSGKNLCNSLEKSLLEDGIKISNLVGICTDAAANFVIAYNSLMAHFRTIKPNVFHFTCICHRLNLIFKDALSKIEKYFFETIQN